jgi:hypothetical protein
MISYPKSSYILQVDVPISPLIPTSDPAVSSWTISPPLSNGLNINSGTGIISGTPTNTQSSTTYTITGDGTYITQLTLTIATSIDTSGTVLLQQNGANVEYSLDAGTNWTPITLWPVTLNNTDTTSPLEVTIISNLTFNNAAQYFIIDSSNITIDGSDNVVNVNVSTNNYPGLLQNGAVDTSGNSNITIKNVGVVSSYRVAQNGGWIGQQYFGVGGKNNNATNCYSTGPIGNSAGGIFGKSSSASVTNCYSIGTIDTLAGGIFGSDSSGSASNCYSIGDMVGQEAGGIFGASSQAGSSATNCHSIGNIDVRGGGIFGDSTTTGVSATSCYSSGLIGQNAGGIFGASSSGSAINCYSNGSTISQTAGGIFGVGGSGSVTNCYSTGDIGQNAGGIFGGSSSGTATNCYSTGTINGYQAGGIFGFNSTNLSRAINCYSTGDIGSNAGGIFGGNSSGSATNCYSIGNYTIGGGEGIGGTGTQLDCYYTDGASFWLDASADASLNVSGTVWTDISLNSDTVPYLLSAFTSTLYSTISATDASNSGISVLTDCSFSIVSVNGLNPSLYPDITIDTDTGDISFNLLSLQNGVYEVNVLATNTNTNDGYSFGTFTNSSTNPIETSGTVDLRQLDGSIVQYSNNGGPWTDAVWPVTLINDGTGTSGVGALAALPLIMTFITDLSLNSADQYFIIDSSNITIDGSDNVVYVNVSTNNYPGLVKNGTGSNANSDITIRNLGVESTNSVADSGGWIGQAYFGNDATENYAINCYSTGDIGSSGGGIFGLGSSGSATNCYSTGDIINGFPGTGGGGIFGQVSQGSASNCYSIGDIADRAGGIFGFNSQGTASNCYSTGDIGSNAGGIFGAFSSGSATNCYSTGNYSSSGGSGIGVSDLSYCYYTDGSAYWSDASANDALDVSGNYTDIDGNSTKVPYRLTSFLNQQTLYTPDTSNNAVTEYPDIANPTDYTWSITSVNGSTAGQTGITIDSNGDIYFPTLSDGTYAVNVLAVDSFGKYSYETFTNIISNICFPAGTPIVTNQGIIAINKINPKIHTIRNKKIVAITKTVSPDKYLVRFEKDALGPNLPSEATTMTKNHMLFYQGQMLKADNFLRTHRETVSKVPYNGQVLYNVLLEEHDKMVVNNLICETLHPKNYVAKMYRIMKYLNPKQRTEFIQKINKEIIRRDIFSSISTSTFGKPTVHR